MASWLCTFAAAVLPLCASSEAQAKPELEKVPPAVVRTLVLERRSVASQIEGYATVLSPDPLVTLDSEIRNAGIALDFSQRQVSRFRTSPTLPKLTLEGAERLLGTDTTQVALLERRLRHTWGDGAPFLATNARRDVVADLAAGTRALVRLDFPTALSGAPQAVTILPLGGGRAVDVKGMWPAPSGNQAMPGSSFFAVLPSGPGLRPGDRATATAAIETLDGVVIPHASIVVSESKSWCYVETAVRTYERRAVPLEHPVEDGYLVTSGFMPGLKVVTVGASTLLARESEPAYGDDDDDDGGGADRSRGKAPDDDETGPRAEAAPVSPTPRAHTAENAPIDSD